MSLNTIEFALRENGTWARGVGTILRANALELKRRQETPNSPAALAKLPMLRLADLDRKNSVIPREVMTLAGRSVLHHDLSTNSIAYIDIGFDLRTLSGEELAYVPVLARALIELGTDEANDRAVPAHQHASLDNSSRA